ncbi:hypothetical protein KQX62_12040 [Rhodopseudomonas palustris]|uniref:Uncharacterized protein n=1 Tax=Rhodopseudomonas palustris TaxID=1076 RepID=A0AAX3DSQ8_RHOPL|nr:hypothetical protein [Rhodopseudomonas palustris]UYO37489.1 hypothetical protein KQX62_12040 [Rhodopseudomonas palustris]
MPAAYAPPADHMNNEGHLMFGDYINAADAIFNPADPLGGGRLFGECLAASVESEPNYPRLDPERHREMLRNLHRMAADSAKGLRASLREFGFSDTDVGAFIVGCVDSFREALPPVAAVTNAGEMPR